MEGPQLNDAELIRLINRHPNIKARIEALLRVADASVAGLSKADDVEMLVRDSIRGLGQNIVENWATSSECRLAAQTEKNQEVKRHTKKNSIGTQPSG
jgi:hypothetical protein